MITIKRKTNNDPVTPQEVTENKPEVQVVEKPKTKKRSKKKDV